ncbi:MAG TPA: hypothetical protein DEW46_09940, partial [Verrucomicrobia bacterium]|nr:hypothetical protein [Verrucomicrobiota bacterium]
GQLALIHCSNLVASERYPAFRQQTFRSGASYDLNTMSIPRIATTNAMEKSLSWGGDSLPGLAWA